MHDAGEPRSVYGNPREQGGLPSFLVLLLTVLSYGAAAGYAVFLRFPCSARASASASFPRSPRRSHILPFCTFAISAIARRAGSRYGGATSRGVPRWFQMIPLSATRSGRMPRRATWETAGPVSSAIFIMVITEYSVGLTLRLPSSYTFRG